MVPSEYKSHINLYTDVHGKSNIQVGIYQFVRVVP